MARLRVWLPVVVVLGAAVLGGCGKTVQLTFINLTGDSVDAYVTSPRQGREYVGVVPPMGKLSHDLTFGKKDLPAVCRWSAGSYSEMLTITDKTPGEVMIDIQALGRPEVRGAGKSLWDELKGEHSPPPDE